MEKRLNAHQTTHSLLNMDGKKQKPWKWDRIFLAEKICPVCKNIFKPKIQMNAQGKFTSCEDEVKWNSRITCSTQCSQILQKQKNLQNQNLWSTRALSETKRCLCCGKEIRPKIYKNRPMSQKAWNLQRFCSISCSKKVENPMFLAGVVEKVSMKLKEIGHQPRIQGGNGKKLTKAQQVLLKKLNAVPEYAVITTEQQRIDGAANCYKLDVALPSMMLGIQLDGNTHQSKNIRNVDKRRRRYLVELGWSILHVSNSRALELCTICKSKDTLLTMLTGSWFTIVI